MTKYLTSKTESGAFLTQFEIPVSDELNASLQCDGAPAQRTSAHQPTTTSLQPRALEAHPPLGTTLALASLCRIHHRFAAPQFAMAD
jgi:hypothetical protein